MDNTRQPLHVWQVGEGAPLVLVHGGLSNGNLAWKRTAEALAPYHRVVVMDRRGHGDSPREPRPYTIAGDAGDLLAVADRLGLTTFHLLGHSYGAIVAYEAAARTPRRVASLHLIEPPMLALAPDDPDVAKLIAGSHDLWRRARHLSGDQVAAAFLEMVAGPEFARNVQGWPVWPVLVDEAQRLPYEENPALYNPPEATALPAELPVRVYSGGRSHPALQVVAKRLAQALPHACLIHLSDAFHEVHKIGAPFEQALLSVTAPGVSWASRWAQPAAHP